MPDSMPHQGLRQSLQTLAGTCLAIAQTRLALLAVDLEQGRNDTLLLIALVLAALVFGGVALGLFSVAVVLAFWDTHRITALGVLAALHALAATALVVACLQRVRCAEGWLRGSLAELAKDRGEEAP